jgi:hypothetical protein
MNKIKILFIIFLLCTFLAGGYFYVIGNIEPMENREENKETTSENSCPDLLIRSGSVLLLINTKLPKSDNNPLPFYSLDEYIHYLEIQKKKGIHCPVLYLQHSYDAQGNPVYKVRPSVSEPQGGLPPSSASTPSMQGNMAPSIGSSIGDLIKEESTSTNIMAPPNPTFLVDATRNDPPYNKNSYPAYDNTSYYTGTTTPLDLMDINQEKQQISPNAMDPNWGGAKYTQSLIDTGYYKENEIQMSSAP